MWMHHFNPRSPHGERPDSIRLIFSTLRNFNPRSPHGERLELCCDLRHNEKISIHAPRTGSDVQASGARIVRNISIHAPRTGSDTDATPSLTSPCNFNPRSPHGERPSHVPNKNVRHRFQSTLPARGATYILQDIVDVSQISIHAPRTGSDPAASPLHRLPSNFNPRSPHGERHYGFQRHGERCRNFNPRSPHGERRKLMEQIGRFYDISIHAPRTGSDKSCPCR